MFFRLEAPRETSAATRPVKAGCRAPGMEKIWKEGGGGDPGGGEEEGGMNESSTEQETGFFKWVAFSLCFTLTALKSNLFDGSRDQTEQEILLIKNNSFKFCK